MNPSQGQRRLSKISAMLKNNQNKDKVSEIVRKFENKSIVNKTQLEVILNVHVENQEQLQMLQHHDLSYLSPKSLIWQAVENDLLPTVKELVEKDYRVKFARDCNGNTPIHLALKRGRVAIAEFLMRTPANLEELDSEENTLLHLAAQFKLNSIFEWLQRRCASSQIFEKNVDCDNCIHVALKSGNNEIARSLLNEYQNIDYEVPGYNDNTYLHYAAIGDCDEEILKFLISKASFINCTNMFDHTPLHEALLNGSEKAARLLYDNGADSTLFGIYNENCFHFAAQGNCYNMINVLKHMKTHIEIKSNLGYTPLQLALSESSVETITALINIKANLSKLDNKGNSIFHHVAKRNLPELLVHLDENSPLTCEPNKYGFTPLHTAVKHDSYKIFNYLIKFNKNINDFCWGTKNTPLHTAATVGNWYYVYGLLLNGADPNAKNEGGQTPIQLALLYNHTHCAEILLLYADQIHTHFCDDGYGVMHYATNCSSEILKKIMETNANCSLSTVNKNTKETLYHSAIEYNNLEVVEFLVSHDIPQKGDINQITPLHVAARFMYPEMFKILLDQLDAEDINVEDENGTRVWDYIVTFGNIELFDCFKERMTVLKKPLELSQLDCNPNALHYAVKRGRLDILHTLLTHHELQKSIDNLDNIGFAPIHYAVKFGNLKAVEYLISFGSNKNVTCHEKKTPLHMAVTGVNNIEMVKYLVKIGANINQQDVKGWSAVHYAVAHGYEDILIYLIQNNANTKLNNAKQQNPLVMATLLNRVNMMEILIQCDRDMNTKRSYVNSILEVVALNAQSYDALDFIRNYEGPNYDVIKMLSQDIEEIL